MDNMFRGRLDGGARHPDEAAEHARRFSGGGEQFREFVDSVVTLVRMLKAYRTGGFPMSLKELATVLGALAYVVNPVDAISEAILGPAGLIDDAGVVLAALASLAAAIVRFSGARVASPVAKGA